MPRNATKSKARPSKPVGGDVTALAPPATTDGHALKWDAASKSYQPGAVSGSGTGDVTGPSSSVLRGLATYADTLGKTLASLSNGPVLTATGSLWIGHSAFRVLLFGSAATEFIYSSPSGTLQLGGATEVILADVNGNEILRTAFVGSAVNEVTVTNAATTGGPIVAASGDDTNIDLNLNPKGTGRLKSGGVNVPTISSTDTFTNKTIDASQLVDGTVSNAKIRDGGACSVIGRSANSSGDVADISAGANNTVLRRTGDTVNFGAVPTSGTVIAVVLKAMAPATLAATETIIAGVSSPAENIPAYAFDAGTIEYMDFICRMSPQYGGGGVTAKHAWTSASATSNACRWEGAFRRIADDAENILGSAHTYDFNAVDATAPSVAGEPVYDDIPFTDGADMDSVAAGELFIYRVRRNASHANDNMTGDAHLITPIFTET